MSSSLDSQFGPIRSFLWPIYAHEFRKIIPMAIILFLICFNYSAVRNMKDALVVTASGAEVIPFIKVWVMLPTAVLLTLLFTKLTNRFSQEQVFYIMVSGFLACFAVFAFVAYPLRDVLHPHVSADYLQTLLPSGFKGLIGMYRHWSFTLFYVVSELWGNIVLTVIFWGFANEITKINEASRFYSVFSIVSSMAAIFAGLSSNYISVGETYNPAIPFGSNAWEQTIMMLVMIVIASGLLAMLVFRWLNKNVLTGNAYDQVHQAKEIRVKKKLSFRESISYVSNSKYLVCIAVIVVAYNLVINLVEIVWKDQLRSLYPSPSDYNNYMNNLTAALGFISTILAFFMSHILERLGWTRTALITPIVMLVTCIGFFTFYFFRYDHIGEYVMVLTGASPLAIAVFFGSAQNALSKAAKYSVFDATKEMAYIPLGYDSKLKGKAAIDGVGSRLGKSGGSLIHQGLLMIFATLTNSAPYVAAILIMVIIFWMMAVKSLGKQFDEISDSTAEPAPAN